MGRSYVTWLDSEEALVTLETAGDDDSEVVAIVSCEGQPDVEVRFTRHRRGTNGWAVLTPEGRVLSARAEPGRESRYEVSLGECRSELRVLEERDAWLASDSGTEDAGQVRVAMPGRVVKVMCAVGDVVEEGQPVLIIEAMKMENEVKIGRSGVVVAVNVKEGESVEADVVLVEVGDGG